MSPERGILVGGLALAVVLAALFVDVLACWHGWWTSPFCIPLVDGR